MYSILAVLTCVTLIPAGLDSRAETVAKLRGRKDEYQAKVESATRAVRAARSPAERAAALATAPKRDEWSGVFLAFERDLAGSAEGLEAALAALRATRDEIGVEAFGRPTPAEAAAQRERLVQVDRVLDLIAKYVALPEFGRFCMEINSESQRCETLFREAMKTNPDRSSRGHATYMLAIALTRRAARSRAVKGFPEREKELEDRLGKTSASAYLEGDWKTLADEAIELLHTVKTEYGDVPLANLRPGFKTTLGEMAETRISAARTLIKGDAP